MANTTLTDPNQGDIHADELFDLEKRASAPNTAGDTAAQDQRDAAMRDNGDNVREQESAGSWANNVSNVSRARDKAQQLKGKGRMTGGKRKKLLAGLGIGGGAGAIIALVMMLLPLKLEMFIQNITKHAMAIPGYAIQHRTEYLVTRAIATRILNVGGVDGTDLVFCKNPANIACSLYKTYSTDFIEKKFGLKIEPEGRTVKITSERNTLGGKAKKWTIETKDVDLKTGNPITKVTEFTKNKEMKKWIADDVEKKIPDKGIKGEIKRFIARKVEMRKHGVTTWRAFERLGAKIDDIKTTIRSKILANVFGRFSTKAALLLGCIDNLDLCQKTIDQVKPKPNELKNLLGTKDLVTDADTLATRDFAKMIMEAMTKKGLGVALKTATKAIPFVGWYLGIDMMMSVVHAIDSGVVDKFRSELVSDTYMAFGYGDSAGIIPNAEKLKNGDLDIDSLGVLTSMFDGAEISPLWAAENGVSNTAMATLFGGTAYAAGSASSSTIQCPGVLGIGVGSIPKGELVCEDQKINASHNGLAGMLHDPTLNYIWNILSIAVPGMPPNWDTLTTAANIWFDGPVLYGLSAGNLQNAYNDWKNGTFDVSKYSTVPSDPSKINIRNYYSSNHDIASAANTIIGAVGDFIIWISSGAAKSIGSFIESITPQFFKDFITDSLKWAAALFKPLFTAIFGIPTVGMDATGAQNYTALSGATRVESNELMQYGQDTDGTPNGGGGQYLSPKQVAAITDAQNASSPKPSYLASLFDPYTQGSLTQQFAIMAPSSGISILGSLLNVPAAIMAGFGTPAYAASPVGSTVANNPFNQVMYGYSADSSELEASPDNYTPETCTTMATAREDSLQIVSGSGIPYPIYTKTDPCALEKTVVGGALADAGVTNDPNSLKDPLTSGSSGAASSGTCPAGMKDEGTSQLVDGSAIHLCGIPGTTDPDTADKIGWVNEDVASQTFDMIKAMQAETGNATIDLASSFRSLAQQQYLYTCGCNGGYPVAAPGTSQHELGHAFDFNLGQGGVDNWLYSGGQANPGRFGYSGHVSYDPIHFSRTGG